MNSLFFSLVFTILSFTQHSNMDITAPSSIYQFDIKTIKGDKLDFKKYAGKKILIVNVASECGFTKQYAQLEELAEHYKDKLVVIGFPCNDFGGQEPGSAEEIQNFCTSKFGVTFPLTEKINIKSKPVHPIYEWLTHKEQNGVLDAKVGWNFNKFLLNEKGQLIAYFGSSVKPLDDDILDLLKD